MSALELEARVEAHEPPEIRGAGRDDVALLVATRRDSSLTHARFRELPDYPLTLKRSERRGIEASDGKTREMPWRRAYG